MQVSSFAAVVSALALRLKRVPIDDSGWSTVMRLWSAGDQGFDDHMLRDIGLSDWSYRRRGQDERG